MARPVSASPLEPEADYEVRERPVSCAHLSTSGQFQAGRPPTVQRGSGMTPRLRQMSTVGRLTPSRSATSWMPTGSQFFMPRTVEKVLTLDKRCGDNHYMQSSRKKLQSEIVPGDVILFFGTPHRIARIDPPTPETLSFFPTCCGFARSEDGWGISLDGSPFHFIEIL